MTDKEYGTVFAKHREQLQYLFRDLKDTDELSTVKGYERYPGLKEASQLVQVFAGSNLKIACVRGFLLFVPDCQSMLPSMKQFNAYEPFESMLIEKYLRGGDTVVDVGANIGHYTLIAADSVGKEGKVIAIEPDKVNCEYLRKNLVLNSVFHVEIHECAVGAVEEEKVLFLSDINVGDHRTWDDGKGRKQNKVKQTTIDKIVDGRKVDLIKIDVQGAELSVLQGARKTIKRLTDLVVAMEFWPNGIRDNCDGVMEVIDILYDELGFQVMQIDQGNRTKTPRLLYMTEKDKLIDLASDLQHRETGEFLPALVVLSNGAIYLREAHDVIEDPRSERDYVDLWCSK